MATLTPIISSHANDFALPDCFTLIVLRSEVFFPIRI